MSTDSHTTAHTPVWGFDDLGQLFVIGTISIDRTVSPVTYTVQADDDQAVCDSEVQAAEWLARQHQRRARYVLIGRVFQPEKLARPSAAEHQGRRRDRRQVTSSANSHEPQRVAAH